jgi:hypothetical protein
MNNTACLAMATRGTGVQWQFTMAYSCRSTSNNFHLHNDMRNMLNLPNIPNHPMHLQHLQSTLYTSWHAIIRHT